jgi:prevent-host-death family protein
MDRIGIRELRANAAATVRRARAGERIVVTLAGRPVAQLGPLDAHDGVVTLDDLVARGLVLPPSRLDPPEPTDAVPGFASPRLDRLFREIRG